MSQRKTMGRVMHEYAHGELKSGPRGQQRNGGGKNAKTTTRRSPRRAAGLSR
jgi:hypothetical protein